MEHAMYISFQLKRSKINKKGLAPINLRITVDGKRTELSTHRSISPLLWDDDSGKVIGSSEEAIILNNYLDALRVKAQKQFNVIESLNQQINVDAVKNKLNGTSEKKHSLIEVFKYHNDQMKLRVGPDYSLVTYKHYKATLEKINSFLSFHYRKSDMLLEELKHSFVINFELYLKSHDKCSHNTTMKHIIRLKKVINLAMANEWINRNPFMNFKCTTKETNRGYLTQEELNILWEKGLKIHRLDKVRDIFIFCCYTGLAYADVEKLTPNDITTGIDGEKWIIIYRKKTDTRSPIPILPQAQKIIDKYKGDIESNEKGTLLPVNSNQRMNGYLKEIADVCGISKNLSMHLARHTFATTITLANGVPIETVSKMLGHTDIKTTQIYSKVVDSKISHDMQILKDKMSKNKLKKAI